MAAPYADRKIDVICSAEARGFIFGAALAYRLGIGFVPVRKPGKLPPETHSVSYSLEYGTDRLELRHDAFAPGAKVLMVDEAAGGVVTSCLFLIELTFLPGREKLAGREIVTVLRY